MLNGNLSDENIRFQLVTFLIAGHETTSGMLSFIIYELLRNPNVMDKVRAEIDLILKGRTPKFEDLHKLQYLDQVIKETLRLWPTAPAFALSCHEPVTTIADNFEITSSDTLMVLLPVLHRDPTIWTNPETFDPDRMSPENFRKLPPNSWKPFGNGQRSCIGRGFAIQESLLILSMIFQRFHLKLADPDYKLTIKETLTLKPENLRIKISRRARVSDQTQHLAPVEIDPILFQSTPLDLHIRYGSNCGATQGFAEKIYDEATRLGVRVSLATLDEEASKFNSPETYVLLCSSYEGRPPKNARKFLQWLETNPALNETQFALFGCGNTDWSNSYQAVPKKMEKLLLDSGATQILERAEADAKGDFFGDFDRWHLNLWKSLSSHPTTASIRRSGTNHASATMT